jgi:hypothetical protein
MRTRLAVRVVVLSVVAAGVLGTAAAETVHYRIPARRALSEFRYVFLGKVTESHRHSASTVEPIRVWKGKWPGDHKRFRVKYERGFNGFPVRMDEYYLFYMNEEGGEIEQAWSVRDPQTRDEIGALDRARNRPPLRLPEEAVALPASALVDPDCLYKWSLPPAVEADLVNADAIMVGRFVSAPRPRDDGDFAADLLASSTIKGQRADSVHVRLPAHPMMAEPTRPAIWFLGPPDPDGRRSVVRSLSLENQEKVRRRYARWKKDGFVCHSS